MSRRIGASLPAACLLAACFHALPAAAQDAPAAYWGRSDCRFAPIGLAPAGAASWKGDCKDGHAHGPGELSWREQDGKASRIEATLARGAIQGEAALAHASGTMYTGTFQDGVPHGKGAFLYPDGTMYEGEVQRGQRAGKGIGVSPTGDRYEGEWRNGVREGQGHMKYALGGEYVGQWRADRRHGRGVLTYIGSGRRFEGEFVDGYIAGKAPPELKRTYDVVDQTGNGVFHPREVARGSPVPPDVGYAAFTPEQKRLFNSLYQALEEGDEPPYPVDGPQEFYKTMAKVTGQFRLRGEVTVYANVGADGKVATIGLVGLDTPELRRYAGGAAAALKYKPAMCRGQPCAMRFPFRLRLVPQ